VTDFHERIKGSKRLTQTIPSAFLPYFFLDDSVDPILFSLKNQD
jgi:hypothetical protein